MYSDTARLSIRTYHPLVKTVMLDFGRPRQDGEMPLDFRQNLGLRDPAPRCSSFATCRLPPTCRLLPSARWPMPFALRVPVSPCLHYLRPSASCPARPVPVTAL